MDDLLQWLREQLDEDERTARAASSGWYGYDPTEQIAFVPPEDTVRIATHSPARVLRELREIDAKRQLLRTYEEAVTAFNDSGPAFSSYDRLTGSVSSLRRAVELLALPYAGRPGYREEWRP